MSTSAAPTYDSSLVIDYPARDMTITVKAEMPCSLLQQILRQEGQTLPIDAASEQEEDDTEVNVGYATVVPLSMILKIVLAPLLLVHLAAAAFWFGALWPLAKIVDSRPRGPGSAVLAHYSRLALRVVPLVLACGVGMSVLFLRSVGEIATPYGGLLLVKTAGFGVAMLVGEINRRRNLSGISREEARAEAAFARAATVEWTLLCAVLVVTAVMTSLFAPEHLESAFGAGHGAEAPH